MAWCESTWQQVIGDAAILCYTLHNALAVEVSGYKGGAATFCIMPLLWKSRDPERDPEQELVDLSEQIKKAEASVERVQKRRYFVRGLILISLIILILYLVISLATHQYSRNEKKLTSLSGLITASAKANESVADWRTDVAKRKVKTLQEKHEKLVSEYEAKTNHDHWAGGNYNDLC